jgi:hypothetical protein
VSLTFVIGTGRCGSTMFSRILEQHPDVLSLNELIVNLANPYRTVGGDSERFWAMEMDGKMFWEFLSTPDLEANGMIRAGLSPEISYSRIARFDVAGGISRISLYILLYLSGDSDSLYGKLATEVPAWPMRSTADHCRALFAVLADITGRRVVVERSGGSVSDASVLERQFPEARFVLLHRNGPDCVLSMSRHPGYRLSALRAMALQFLPEMPTTTLVGDSIEELAAAAPEEFMGLLAPPFDKQRFMSYPIPLSLFAYIWSYLTRTGVSALREMPRSKFTIVSYEGLVNSPRTELTRLARFIGLPTSPQWLDQVCDFVDAGHVGSAVSQLDPDKLALLQTACVPGARALASLELVP